ncbi:protein-tyrosine phosphatase-like protein, partial [Pelagophyceae sp. CCMP2097]
MLRPIAPPLLGDVARRAPAVGDCGEPAADVAHAPFPPELRELESFECIAGRREDYVGPTDESNWVLPGKLMVGAFPGVADDDENERLLTSILEMGITTFVCLQREYEPDAPEIAWRTGQAIRPYFTSAVNVAAQLDASSAEAPPRKLAFIHFGIVDCATVEDDAVLRFVRALALRLRNAAEVVYLHCWGGHGRTGTVVCLLLYLLYGLDARQALHRCQFVHDLRRVPCALR